MLVRAVVRETLLSPSHEIQIHCESRNCKKELSHSILFAFLLEEYALRNIAALYITVCPGPTST
jgi:hypothetical protein